MREEGKYDVKVNVIPNELENYMAVTISNNLGFTNRIQFTNSILYPLVKNLSKRSLSIRIYEQFWNTQ